MPDQNLPLPATTVVAFSMCHIELSIILFHMQKIFKMHASIIRFPPLPQDVLDSLRSNLIITIWRTFKNTCYFHFFYLSKSCRLILAATSGHTSGSQETEHLLISASRQQWWMGHDLRGMCWQQALWTSGYSYLLLISPTREEGVSVSILTIYTKR